MSSLSAGEKALLRTGRHKATLYLSVLKPSSVFTARVNMVSPAQGARDIVYDGDAGDERVVAGMTLWVGSLTAGAGTYDVGKVRVRSINTSTNVITVAENSIVWAEDQYLTCKENWELWPIFPWFDADVFKKDGPDGDTYTDENEKPPPVAIMGPPQCGFLMAGSLVFNLDGGQSYAIATGKNIAGYAWAAAAGTLGTPSVQATTWRHTAAKPNGTWCALTVTDNNSPAKTQVTRRPSFVHERTGANAPITAFTLESLSGDWERGGWTARFTVYGTATVNEFPDGAMIVLWHEATYGSTTQQIGGYKYNNADARNVLFVGYVRGETVEQNWNTGTVSFEATTIDGLLRQCSMLSVPLTAPEDGVDEWYEYDSPTVAQAVHHYWRWHSSLFEIADVFLPVSNTLLAKAIDDFGQGELYSQVDNFAREYGIFAHACCNKWGAVHLEEDIQILDATARAGKTVVSEINIGYPTDLREEITIVRRPEKQAAMAHLEGIAWDGATATAYLAIAPGECPESIGSSVVKKTRQILDDQAQANELAGRVLAVANNPYPELRVKFAGHYLGALDLVPQEWWTLTLAAGATPRGIAWTAKPLIARNIAAHYDPAAGSILADAVFEAEADGEDGVTVDPPDVPDEDDIEPPPAPVTPDAPPAANGRLIAFDNVLGCQNQTVDQGWQARNTGAATIADNQGGYDPHWQAEQGSTDIEDAILWRVQDGAIYRSIDCGRNWTLITGMGDPPNTWGWAVAPTFANCEVVVRTDNIYQSGEHYFLVRCYSAGEDEWGTWVLKCTGNGAVWTWGPLGGPNTVPNQYAYSEVAYTPGSQAGGYTIVATSRSNILGSTTGNNAKITGDTDGATQVRMEWIFSLGGLATGVDRISFDHVAGNAGSNFHYYTYTSENGVDWSYLGDCTITTGATGTSYLAVSPSRSVRYIRLSVALSENIFHLEKYHYLDRLYARVSAFSSDAGLNGYGVWADTDTADGAYLYATMCVGDILYLYKIATGSLSAVSNISLGAATIAEVLAGTYLAYPRVKEFDPSVMYVYGRMNAPAGLSGVQHIIKSLDSGVTFASVISDWDTHHCGVFQDADAEGILSAIRNTGAAPIYYRGATLAEVGALPLAEDVPVDAFTGMPGRIAVGAGSAVCESVDNGLAWVDQGYPAGGDIRSLVYV